VASKIVGFFLGMLMGVMLVGCSRTAPTPPPTVQINIIVDKPQHDDLVKSGFLISGRARGFWYFEASFPVALYDSSGKELVRTFIMADGDWMTTDFVPFHKNLTFPKPETLRGCLVLEKDNPSGLPENDEHISIPVYFEEGKTLPYEKVCQ
jgi:hypothetical protein